MVWPLWRKEERSSSSLVLKQGTWYFARLTSQQKNRKKYTRWKLTGSCHVCKLTLRAWRDAGLVSLRILEQSNWTLYPDLAWITNHFDSNKAAIFKPWDWEGGELRRWAHPSIECGPASFVNFAFNWEDVASGSRVANLLYVGTEGSLRRKQHLPLHRIEAVAVHWPARRVQLPLHPPQICLRWGAIGKVWIHPHWGRTSSSDAILILHIRKLKEGDKYWGRANNNGDLPLTQILHIDPPAHSRDHSGWNPWSRTFRLGGASCKGVQGELLLCRETVMGVCPAKVLRRQSSSAERGTVVVSTKIKENILQDRTGLIHASRLTQQSKIDAGLNAQWRCYACCASATDKSGRDKKNLWQLTNVFSHFPPKFCPTFLANKMLRWRN